MDPARTIGDYRLEESLGQGASGSVFAARHRESGERVAIKVLRAGTSRDADEEQRRRVRFEREAQLGSRLDHPGIARVLGFGEQERARYLVMELVEGARTLDVYAREERLEPIECVELMLPICRALAAAHDQGVVHRDLKPENLLVTRAGGIKVVDFGVAREVDVQSLTQSGAFLGTAAYMAPEQVSLGARHVDARCDVHALGGILFELISGELPYRGDSVVEVLEAIANGPPPNTRLLGSRAPPGLDRVLTRALAKEPDERYADAGELGSDLAAVVAGRALPGAASSNRVLLALAVALLLVATVVVLLLSSREAEEDAARTEEPVASSPEPLPTPPKPRPETTQDLLHQATVIIDRFPARRDDEDQALALLTRALERDPRLTQVHGLRARVLMRRGDVEPAVVELNQAIAAEPQPADLYRRGILMQSGLDLKEALDRELPEPQASHARAMQDLIAGRLSSSEGRCWSLLRRRFAEPTQALRRLEPGLWRTLAGAARRRGRREDARAYTDKAAAIVYGDTKAMAKRADAAQGQAVKAWTSGGPTSKVTRQDWAPSSRNVRLMDEALYEWSRVLELQPNDPRALRGRMAVINYRARAEARTQRDPRPFTRIGVADANLLLQQEEKAYTILLRALFRQYDLEHTLRIKTDPLGLMGSIIEDLERVIALDPRSMDGHYILGTICYQRAQLHIRANRIDEARADYRRLLVGFLGVLRLDPDYYAVKTGEVHFLIGVARFGLNQEQPGLEAFAEAIRRQPRYRSQLAPAVWKRVEPLLRR